MSASVNDGRDVVDGMCHSGILLIIVNYDLGISLSLSLCVYVSLSLPLSGGR